MRKKILPGRICAFLIEILENMKLKNLVEILCLSCFVAGGGRAGFAQNYNNLQAVPSSDGMSLIRSIQNPVDYSTGVTAVQVPLYTIQTPDLQVPVALAYQASGLKIEDRASSVGLGWRFAAGGRITRIVKQKPDEKYSSRWGISDTEVAREFYQYVGSAYQLYNEIDAEPDLFFFEIPGKSGMFVFDHTGTAHTIPYQNLAIRWIGKTSFEITDEKGVKYRFGTVDASRETTTVEYQNPNLKNGQTTLSYVSTWHLDEIESYAGNKVTFTYAYGSSVEETRRNTTLNLWSDHTVINNSYNSITTTVQPRLLNAVRWDGGSMTFLHDISKNRISSFEVSENTNLKSVEFVYTPHPVRAEDFLLHSIRERYSDDTGRQVYAFAYNTARHLPLRTASNFDHWGYCNGEGYVGSIPNFSVPGRINYTGADREPSLEYTSADVLTEIRYPTGGKVQYEYELNSYWNEGMMKPGGGLRIREIRQVAEDGKTMRTRYDYRNSGRIVTPPVTGYVRMTYISINGAVKYPVTISSKPLNDIFDLNGTSIYYTSVDEIRSDGSRTRYDYGNLSADSPPLLHQYYSASDVRLNVGSSNLDCRNIVSVLPVTSRFWRKRLLRQVTRYDVSGTKIVSQQRYTYELDEDARAIVKAYVPYVDFLVGIEAGKYVGEYQWESQPCYLKKVENVATDYEPGSEQSFVYDTEHLVPTTVANRDAEGNTIENTIAYPWNYTVPAVGEGSPLYGLYLLQRDRIVVPVESVTRRNGEVIAGELTTFQARQVGARFQAVPAASYALRVENPLTDFVPSRAEGNALVQDTRYDPGDRYDCYDRSGNVITRTSATGQQSATVFGYGNSHPIAEVGHARHSEPRYILTRNDQMFDYLWEYPVTTDYFIVPHEQTIRFEIYRNHHYVNAEVTCTYEIGLSASQVIFRHTDVASPNSEDDIGFSATLPAGRYRFHVRADKDAPQAFYHIDFSIETTELAYDRTNEIFHTSFEDETGSVRTDKAKTGENVWKGEYAIDLRNFAAGTYVLSYWSSTDAGNTWQKVKETLTVAASAASKTIGGNYYIDEIRILPKDARMKTYTYREEIGKTSEMDHNGNVTYYRYDTAGRLYRELDNDGKVLREYEYHYQNE